VCDVWYKDMDSDQEVKVTKKPYGRNRIVHRYTHRAEHERVGLRTGQCGGWERGVLDERACSGRGDWAWIRRMGGIQV